jgi:hypothetical protein
MSDEDVVKPEGWIDELEIENAQIKWAFSHFDGEQDMFNDPGDHNFIVMLPEDEAKRLSEIGWNIKEKPGMEEGDPSEWHLKVKISDRYGVPMIWFIKNKRRFRVEHLAELKDIKRQTCENIDVIIQPSRWVRREETGISAYVKEMYVTISQSRFAAAYEDYEEVR